MMSESSGQAQIGIQPSNSRLWLVSLLAALGLHACLLLLVLFLMDLPNDTKPPARSATESGLVISLAHNDAQTRAEQTRLAEEEARLEAEKRSAELELARAERARQQARIKIEAAQARRKAEKQAQEAKAAREKARARIRQEALQKAAAIQAQQQAAANNAAQIAPSTQSTSESNTAATNTAATSINANPRYRRQVQPVYPRRARQRNIEGTVIVEADLDALGKVTKARVFQSSGHSQLDKSALTAIKKSTFVPASTNGQAVPSKVHVPVQFKLK